MSPPCLCRVFLHRFRKHSPRSEGAASITEERHLDEFSGSGWTVARQALEILSPLAGTIPALGIHIQSLIDTARAVIYVIERTHSWKAGRVELCLKIQNVLGIIADALGQRPSQSLHAPDLERDLEAFTEILIGIEEFLAKKRKNAKLFHYFTSIADYETVLAFSGRFDDAVKMLLLKSSIQTRLDIQALKQSTESLQEAFQRSASTMESMVTVNKEKLVAIQSGVSRIEAEITPPPSVKEYKIGDEDGNPSVKAKREQEDKKRNYCDCSNDSDITKKRVNYKESTRDEEPGGTFAKEETSTHFMDFFTPG